MGRHFLYPQMLILRRRLLNLYLSGHAPDKYTLTREPHRNAAAKPGPQAGTPLSKGIQRM